MNLFHVEEAEFSKALYCLRSHMIGGCLYVSLFRLASPEDYEYIEELNLWELSFDKRPVQGVRCEDPVIGAENIIKGVKNLRR
ncbi:hypothetical protein J4727_20480 [Providencia rettgeri]|uniref:Uncharacterized protein n=1 Tax=Providencia rettgeri TaxID=587 RepID=A0A939NBS9_PRORE|nr:hypothetical protein [Providencia rettgeri]